MRPHLLLARRVSIPQGARDAAQLPLLHAGPHASPGDAAYVAMYNYAIKSHMYFASPGHFILGMEVFLIALFLAAEISENRHRQQRGGGHTFSYAKQGRAGAAPRRPLWIFRPRVHFVVGVLGNLAAIGAAAAITKILFSRRRAKGQRVEKDRLRNTTWWFPNGIRRGEGKNK